MTDEELRQLVAANAQAIQALNRDVSRLVETQQQGARNIDRLVETQQQGARNIDRLVETQQQGARDIDRLVEAQQQAAEERQELRQLIDSNARAIQAFADTVAADREEMREATLEMREAILRLTNVQEGIANLLASLDDDRPTILRKLTAIENKVDRLLQQKEGDRE